MDTPVFFDDWAGIGRILVTAPLAYLALIVMLRTSGKRTLSKFNAFDFVVTICLGSMLASIILTKSVPLIEGVVALALLICLQFVITWLSVRSQAVETLVKSEPALLVHRGTYQDKALREERVTREEITAALHASGEAELSAFHSVVLETDGSLNVFKAV
ncbi:MAG: DUF421 domain-containing protein [Hoeflea sp.]|uniref:DUF421 domain-containing protein n=1 Tax=Hoeflea sp. TaxID=1940281 RepID=UPI001D220475|nr:YetF domain-containing protein [Hoeflea sp.]MBU4529964.1 DUF421 domain-containing protein [Alphaproteobacteria bacterium]MBU4543191.1 DUF421 domain-containing protein [Alphaproteobacteria bacterium]MBU4550269.1 DUF421 domain-containing protein [Alphaproteobacteria bacterium]MBV1722457.1 DUF421 domain-containing protein [Hoeflea sp.]MBV1761607.1 DUF421 domain-containing protein [Hoeflea sp.]